MVVPYLLALHVINFISCSETRSLSSSIGPTNSRYSKLLSSYATVPRLIDEKNAELPTKINTNYNQPVNSANAADMSKTFRIINLVRKSRSSSLDDQPAAKSDSKISRKARKINLERQEKSQDDQRQRPSMQKRRNNRLKRLQELFKERMDELDSSKKGRQIFVDGNSGGSGTSFGGSGTNFGGSSTNFGGSNTNFNNGFNNGFDNFNNGFNSNFNNGFNNLNNGFDTNVNQIGGGDSFSQVFDPQLQDNNNADAEYQFSYTVQDPEENLDFGHAERRSNDFTEGQYRVLLPDGRLQIVTYTVRPNEGYKAQVTYQNQGGFITNQNSNGVITQQNQFDNNGFPLQQDQIQNQLNGFPTLQNQIING